MASSDDEGELVPQSVIDYHFVDDRDELISFSVLPFQMVEDEILMGATKKAIFMHGKADRGLQTIYKEVTAWKLDLSYEQHEIWVLSRENCWIKLQKPRKSFKDTIRTILITVHCLHFAKKNPEASGKTLWKYIRKIFSLYEVIPSEKDLLHHLPLIRAMLGRDKALAKSKFLLAFLENRKESKASIEDMRIYKKNYKVITEDGEDMDKGIEDADGDEFDDDPALFDSVCAICDNGGEILSCEGRCMRSFHATTEAGADSFCESLQLSEAKVEAIPNFLCPNCQYEQHQCFACGKLGSSDKSSGAEVFRCVSATCGHFYHPVCVARLLHQGNEAKAKEHWKRIVAGEPFTCPVHKCHICKQGENKVVEEMQFAICRRCPRAYHQKCLPRKISLKPIEDEDIIQRAWPGLIPNRLLIYCLKHVIENCLGTPVRNHIIFPDVEKRRSRPLDLQSSMGKIIAKKKGIISEDPSKEKSDEKIGRKIENGSLVVLDSRSMKKGEKSSYELGFVRSKKFKETDTSNKSFKGIVKPILLKVDKSSAPEESKGSVRQKLTNSVPSKRLEAIKLMPKDMSSCKLEVTSSSTIMKKLSKSSPLLDSKTKIKIMDLIRKTSSSITLEDIMKKYNPPSTYAYSSRNMDKTITRGKVEGSVEAVRTALQKLDDGCSIEDAKAVCEPEILNQIIKWKNKLKIYLAPFLHGMRYTSFGRHFTKVDKLKEIIDELHWYVESGDMIVDFCCGANDFSRLMRDKLEKIGKKCLFKNYDLIQPKNDFNFEKRDWMSVHPQELPAGSHLIMGLNPPFGAKASLANKFINKALEFNPKLLVLIVPRETERLDVKKSRYDLIWEDSVRLSGKSFYLPGSVDVNDKQMDQWNLNAPVLYFWSHPDWTAQHMTIAFKQGHICKVQKKPFINQVEMNASDLWSKDREFNDNMDISDDLSEQNDQAEASTEPRITVAELQNEISPEHNTCRHEEIGDGEGYDDTGNRRKRIHENPGREYKGKQARTGGKNNSSSSLVTEMFGEEMLLQSRGTDSRGLGEGGPFEASKAGSEKALHPSQLEFSSSCLESGTGYGGSRGTPLVGFPEDRKRRYSSNKDYPLIIEDNKWSTSRSYGIRGSEEVFPGHVNDRAIASFGQSASTDCRNLVNKYRLADADPIEKYVNPDMLPQIQLNGQQYPADLSRTGWHPSDHGLGNVGRQSSSFRLSSPAVDSPRLSTLPTQQYAPHLSEMNYSRTSPFTPQLPLVGSNSIFATTEPRTSSYGRAVAAHRPSPYHNSSSWLGK